MLGSIILSSSAETDVYDVYGCITEASGNTNTNTNNNFNTNNTTTTTTGWNDYLDNAWKGAVINATSPTVLMECTILLEHFINKEW